MADRLVLATHNHDKARELAQLLGEGRIHVLTLDAYPQIGDITEDGVTLEENALKKARTVHEATGLPVLADDSGLEVYYLNGEPGVFSSRYSGSGATYESNCKKLLSNMVGVPPRRRRARFRSVLAFMIDGTETVVEGVCDGVITEDQAGSGGFGYDPVFLPDGSSRTFAEMTSTEKNLISHRGKALLKMKPILEEHLG